jgi:hypothetical protein
MALQQKYQKAGQEYEKVLAHIRKGAWSSDLGTMHERFALCFITVCRA